jgi:hypothetical protein
LGSIVVTHPFHPLSGETLLIAFERRDPVHERLFVCEAGPARVALPLSWTDRATDVRLAHRLGPEGLAALAELVAALQDPLPTARDVP